MLRHAGKRLCSILFCRHALHLKPKPKLPAKNSNQGENRGHDATTTSSSSSVRWARGSACVFALHLHGIPAPPASQLKKLRPRVANKMPKGTQLPSGRSGTCPQVLIENPGSSDHVSCAPLRGHGGGACSPGFGGNAPAHLPQAGPSVSGFPGHWEGTRT